MHCTCFSSCVKYESHHPFPTDLQIPEKIATKLQAFRQWWKPWQCYRVFNGDKTQCVALSYSATLATPKLEWNPLSFLLGAKFLSRGKFAYS